MTIPRRQFRAIGANIEKIVKPILSRRGFGVATIVNSWADIVGPVLAKHTFPEQISYRIEFKNGFYLFGTELKRDIPELLHMSLTQQVNSNWFTFSILKDMLYPVDLQCQCYLSIFAII